MYEQTYRVTIEGITPLLMHADDIDWADTIAEERTRIKEKDKKNFSAGDDRCPPHTWKGYLYNDGERICLTTDQLRSCLKSAGAKKTLSGRKTYKSLTQSGIMFSSLFAPLSVGGSEISMAAINAIDGTYREQVEAVRKLGFMLYAKRARVGMSKHIRVRPRFDKWSATTEFTVVDEQLAFATVEEIWKIAGLKVGLGDWCPSKASPGPYGMFRAEVQSI